MAARKSLRRLAVAATACVVLWASAAAAAVVTRRLGSGLPPSAAAGKLPEAWVAPAKEAPAIDGKLDDAAWAQTRPVVLGKLESHGQASPRTEARLVHKDRVLYVAVKLAEPNVAGMKRSVTEADGPCYRDDSIELFLSPHPDRGYFQMIVSATGAIFDRHGHGNPTHFDAGAQAAVEVGRDGWSLEVAIPTSALGVGEEMPQRWRANIYRNRQAGGQGESQAFSPTFRGDFDVPERFGYLLFTPTSPWADLEKAAGSERGITVEPLGDGTTVMLFDLSSIPKGAKVRRARLRCEREPIDGLSDDVLRPIEIYPLSGPYRARRGSPDPAEAPTEGLQTGGETSGPAYRARRGSPDPAEAPTEGLQTGGETSGPAERHGRETGRSAYRKGARPPTSAEPLRLIAPWYDAFELTDQVRRWVAAPSTPGVWVKTFPGWRQDRTFLDVMVEGEPQEVPPAVSDVKAFHRSGQTFLTWREIDDPLGRDDIAWGEMKSILGDLDRRRQTRYCIYRSTHPITPQALPQAELIAEVKPLSGWNLAGRNIGRPIDDFIATARGLRWHQWNPFQRAGIDGDYGRDCPIDRFVVRDGQPPLRRGTGLYVHTASTNQRAYYAVLTAVDGIENTREIRLGLNVAGPVDEAVAEPQPVLQRELPRSPFFHYDQRRLHYVRWVAPPLTNKPYDYHNWSVGVPVGQASSLPGGQDARPTLELNRAVAGLPTEPPARPKVLKGDLRSDGSAGSGDPRRAFS